MSIKYIMLFLANFDSPPLCHTLSHIPGLPPPKVRHTSRTPPFLVGLVQKTWTKNPCTNSLSIVHRGFCQRVFSLEVLSGVVFVRSPFCQNISVTTES